MRLWNRLLGVLMWVGIILTTWMLGIWVSSYSYVLRFSAGRCWGALENGIVHLGSYEMRWLGTGQFFFSFFIPMFIIAIPTGLLVMRALWIAAGERDGRIASVMGDAFLKPPSVSEADTP